VHLGGAGRLLISATFDVDAPVFTEALERHVREQLATLPRERPEF
jgi:hypothetical protein